MVSKGEPLVEVQEAKPPGGFQGKALIFFLQTIALIAKACWLAFRGRETYMAVNVMFS